MVCGRAAVLGEWEVNHLFNHPGKKMNKNITDRKRNTSARILILIE
jgi:hypothetical protein